MTTVWDCSKMNRVALLIAAFLLLALVSCGRHGTVGVSNRKELKLNLSKAETLIGTDDSLALALLCDINPESIKNPKQYARYALLYSEALYKNFIPVSSDSLIMTAVRYYSSGNDKEKQFRSYYMLGCIYSDMGLTTDAAVALGQAEQLVGEINDDYRLGLLYSNLGNIFFDSFDFDRALQYYRLAHSHYEIAGKKSHKLHAFYDIGRCLMEMDKIESAHQLFKEVEEQSSECSDWELSYSSLCSQISSSLEMSNLAQASEEIDRLLQLFGFPEFDPFALSLLAKHSTLIGRYSESDSLIHLGWKYAATVSDSIYIYLNECLLERQSGDTESALLLYEKAIYLQQRNLFFLQNKPALGAMKDYYKEIAQIEALKASRKQSVLILLSLSFLLFVIATVVFLMYRKAKSDAQLNELGLVIKDLKLKEDTNYGIINKLNGQINLLFSRTYSDLDQIFAELLEAEISLEAYENRAGKNDGQFEHPSPACLYKKIRNSFNELTSDKYQKQLDDLINVTYDDIMNRISSVNLKERELLMLRLSFAGFSPKTISHITRIPVKTFYQSRSRIIKKIQIVQPYEAESICKLLCIKHVSCDFANRGVND